jgi:hypothetical protein
MKVAYISKEANGWLRVRFKYDPKVNVELKTAVGYMNYRFEGQSWFVKARFSEKIISLLKRHGYKVYLKSERRESSKQIYDEKQNLSEAQAWIILFTGLGKVKAHELYKKAILILHPDVAGAAYQEHMKQLNVAWSEFGRRLKV